MMIIHCSWYLVFWALQQIISTHIVYDRNFFLVGTRSITNITRRNDLVWVIWRIFCSDLLTQMFDAAIDPHYFFPYSDNVKLISTENWVWIRLHCRCVICLCKCASAFLAYYLWSFHLRLLASPILNISFLGTRRTTFRRWPHASRKMHENVERDPMALGLHR